MKPLILKALAVPLVVGAVAAQAFNGPVAAAEPYAAAVSDPSEPTGPGVTPPITWTQLGLSDRLDLIGSNQPVETSVPVPAGVGPTVLVGQIGSVVNVSNGRVDVLDGRGVALGSVVVPADLATVPFSVDLSAAQVTEGRATLRFVLRDSNPSITSCSQPPAVTLNQLSTSYSGPTPDPVTVADFLPGYLDQVVVRVGSRPTTSQQQAALDLDAEHTHLYRPMPVRIDIATFDDATEIGSRPAGAAALCANRVAYETGLLSPDFATGLCLYLVNLEIGVNADDGGRAGTLFG